MVGADGSILHERGRRKLWGPVRGVAPPAGLSPPVRRIHAKATDVYEALMTVADVVDTLHFIAFADAESGGSYFHHAESLKRVPFIRRNGIV